MDTSSNVNSQVKIPWTTRPWNKDWIFWVFLFFWTAFSWQLMFSQGRSSSAAWLPAIIDLIFNMLTGFASTLVLVAVPLLVARRLVRGYLAKKRVSSGELVRDYGQNEACGWGVWLLVALSISAILFWFGGRSQNVLLNVSEGQGIDWSQVNPDLAEQLETFTPTSEELMEFWTQETDQKPGFQAIRAYEEIQESLNNYFAVDPTSGDFEVVSQRLRGYIGELTDANAELARNLDLVTRQSEMPSSSPDIKLLKDFSSALQPWIDARLSYYAAQEECQSKKTAEAFFRCQDLASEKWEPVMTSTIPPLEAAIRPLRP
jgi:hypothetical protein